jgi:hypothetical protein
MHQSELEPLEILKNNIKNSKRKINNIDTTCIYHKTSTPNRRVGISCNPDP